uniref:Uncharacterized protein n=1 Tax=Timema poppense TaxID=170557 RepID=A0A7R9D8M8_TIMPO|nr:unnamed protein product [Timema poppensis]
MKLLVVVLLLGIVTRGSTQGLQDVAGFLQDPALVRRQLNCVINQGPCDATGEFIKRPWLDRQRNTYAPTTLKNGRLSIPSTADYLFIQTYRWPDPQRFNTLYGWLPLHPDLPLAGLSALQYPPRLVTSSSRPTTGRTLSASIPSTAGYLFIQTYHWPDSQRFNTLHGWLPLHPDLPLAGLSALQYPPRLITSSSRPTTGRTLSASIPSTADYLFIQAYHWPDSALQYPPRLITSYPDLPLAGHSASIPSTADYLFTQTYHWPDSQRFNTLHGWLPLHPDLPLAGILALQYPPRLITSSSRPTTGWTLSASIPSTADYLFIQTYHWPDSALQYPPRLITSSSRPTTGRTQRSNTLHG